MPATTTDTPHPQHCDCDTVTVVIPMYRSQLSDTELISLRQTCRVLARHRLVVVKPQGLDLSAIAQDFPMLEFEDFPPEYFAGIKGYNNLVTSEEFYDRFSDREYLLIAQLDTYIFRDELAHWCAQGYDYVGAPWLQRPLNRIPPVSWLKALKDRLRRRKGLYSKTALYNRVGNGGLSLRRVSSHRQMARKYRDELQRLNNIGPKGQPEDVFWAMLDGQFTYPTAQEALGFAFDKYPRYCYRLTGHRLPMGCHGWTSRKMKNFWKRFINQS